MQHFQWDTAPFKRLTRGAAGRWRTRLLRGFVLGSKGILRRKSMTLRVAAPPEMTQVVAGLEWVRRKVCGLPIRKDRRYFGLIKRGE
ncbi:hypothetical protein QN219_12745 [Sinorhizobium sp. 7-81]|uniref:hypothetical protein n=1 Tax=Sinorhizobium sp. 8-89 TaxID=3049089 RepID=UPI0024C2E47C|nr:hypothetical protein [Sinorhizobium sp. 8-89]MDK1490926.1 hypothetical protein [Sinorhizobium sp. 8-89]